MKEFKPFLLGTYGTLKQGFGNHGVIKNCKFVGSVKTLPEFTMYEINWFPGIIHKGNNTIQLEVYEISDENTARKLNRLEGYPDLYNKETITTLLGDVVIYIYNYPIDRLTEIKSGNWE